MNKTPGNMARRAAYTCVALLPLCASSGLLTAQTLRITEPKPGTVVNPGQTLIVAVDAAPALAFREMIVIGQDPAGIIAR